MNGLKTINDLFGHKYGNLLIQQVSEVFKTSCRADDIVSRTGGDEFVLLLPKTDAASALELVNRINETFGTKKIMDINISVAWIGYKNNGDSIYIGSLKKCRRSHVPEEDS